MATGTRGPASGWLPLRAIAGERSIAWPDGGPQRGDPYLFWAEATTRTVPKADNDLPTIGVLVELAHPPRLDWLLRSGNFVPDRLPQPGERRRFVTGVVNRAGLKQLLAELGSPGQALVTRFTIQASRSELCQAQWDAFRTLSSGLPSVDDGGPIGKGAEGIGPVFLGLIDDALPFAQVTQLLQPRLALWDQGWLPDALRLGEDGLPASPIDLPGPDLGTEWEDPWDPPPLPLGMLYGRRLKSGRIVKPERTWYKAAAYVDPPPAGSHGAAVLGRLAPWMTGRAASAGQWPLQVAGLAMVQLPSLTVEDTSGSAQLDRHVLNAIDFVLWQELVTREGKAPRRVLVNISYGVQQGPHDGTSMFEAAAEFLLQQHPNLSLVVPAGNAHRERSHSRQSLLRAGLAGAAFTLPLMVMPDNGRDTFVEIWIEANAQVQIEILPPGHATPLTAAKGQAQAWVTEVDGAWQVEFAVLFPPTVAQGNGSLMVLLAIAPTRKLGDSTGIGLNGLPRKHMHAPHGLWQVRVVNLGASLCVFDAYIARGDAAPDSARGSRQAYFVDSAKAPAGGHASTPTGTLSGIATLCHPRYLVVGALREAQGSLADYSAAGPTRDGKRDFGPDVVVKADRSVHRPGLPTAGFSAGVRACVDGTSIACAVHAHALALGMPKSSAPQDVAEVPPRSDRGPRAPDANRGQMRRDFLAPEPGPPP